MPGAIHPDSVFLSLIIGLDPADDLHMDWILIGAIVIAGWSMLSVLSGERLGQAQRAAILLASAAAEQAANAPKEIPIARSSNAGNASAPGWSK